MSEPTEDTVKTGRVWRRMVLFGIPLVGAGAAFILGIIFWGGFNTAMEATNTMDFCISCHEMKNNVYEEYKPTIHHQNRTGVQAVCSDCHVPHNWGYKMIRKIKASREIYSKLVGTIDTREKFLDNRLRLAKRVWTAMKETDSRECRNCHTIESMAPEFQVPRARQQHLNAMETGQTCIDCHKGIAHNAVRDQLSDEEIDALEAPNPKHIKEVPQTFLDSLAYIEKVEAEQAVVAAAAVKATEDAVTARVAAAVKTALAEEQARQAAADTPATDTPAGAAATDTPPVGSVAAGVDWAAVTPQQMTLFYPGQASFEWVQIGKQHGGARPFTKGGEKCSTCHGKEVRTIGEKIVSGAKLEPTPIPGKRGAIDVALQATHDDENLYLRLQWQDAGHTPVPFVEGGKMDPENQIKVAMMIAGKGIERVEQAGCWATCHNDNRFMPDAPDAAALATAGDVATRLGVMDGPLGGVTKYLAESRTDIELKGKNRPLGGWDLLEDESKIAEYLETGSFMDLLRVGSGGHVDNGHLLERRAEDGAPMAAETQLEGDTWTVVLSRPLAASGPGDVAINPGETYTVGFAIHDDYTAARFHHVSLDITLGLDDAEAAINAVKQ